jgi:hypothetical protein
MNEARGRVQVDRAIALTGTAQASPDGIVLEAGPVSMTLENGALRWIRLGDIEVIRGIAFLIRDRNWGTPVAEIAGLDIVHADGGFRVVFNAVCRTEDGMLPWSAEITATADGTVRFAARATPTADFTTNRTGFVILHPLDRVAGCPVEVTHTDGTRRRARFPALIDPEQCFFDIRALSHEPMPGIRATCTMEGDAWEMEDHRNWLDASFKTYVRPLALPYPYVIPGGSTVDQSVTLTFPGALPKPRRESRQGPVEIALGEALSTSMPKIGLRAPVQWLQQARDAAPTLREVGAQLINGRIDPRQGHGEREIRDYATLAETLGAELMLEYLAPCRTEPAVELEAFAAALRRSGAHPESIAVAPAEDRIRQEPGAPPPPLALLGAVYRAAREALPGMTIGGGTFAFFTELNRNWPPLGLIDYVTHMTSSTVHAADDRAMMENLESFRHMRETVRAFAGAMPHRLVAAQIGLEIGSGEPAPNPNNLRVALARMDPRQRGLFGAAWALGYVAAFAYGGAEVVTMGAPTGPAGIIYRRTDYPQPYFDNLKGPAVYPSYHVVAGLGAALGGKLMAVKSSDPAAVASLAYRAGKGPVLWLANLTGREQAVKIGGLGKAAMQLHLLDEDSFQAAATDPGFLEKPGKKLRSAGSVKLGPYAVARLSPARK